DAALVARAGRGHRRVVLLRAVDEVREAAVGDRVVHLRGGLVVLPRPALPSVEAHVGPAVVALDHAQGIVGRDPQVVVVAVGRTQGREGLPAVLRAEEADVEDVHRFRVPGVGEDVRVVPRALAQAALVVDALPGRPRVLAAVDAAVLGLDQGPDA